MSAPDWTGYFGAQSALISFPILEITGDFYRDSLILAGDLDRLALNIRSLREPLTRAVKEVIIPSIRANFSAEGRPSWAPLALDTIRIRGASGPILNRTGILLRTATQFNIWKIDMDSAVIVSLDSKVKYAKYHQSGTKNMPQREFIKYQEHDEIEIEAIFYSWLVDRSVRMGRFTKT